MEHERIFPGKLYQGRGEGRVDHEAQLWIYPQLCHFIDPLIQLPRALDGFEQRPELIVSVKGKIPGIWYEVLLVPSEGCA